MRALTKLAQLNLDTLVTSITNTATKTGELVASPQLKAAIESLPVTLNKLDAAAHSIQRLATSANREVAVTTASLRQTTSSATLALQQTQNVVDSAQIRLDQLGTFATASVPYTGDGDASTLKIWLDNGTGVFSPLSDTLIGQVAVSTTGAFSAPKYCR